MKYAEVGFFFVSTEHEEEGVSEYRTDTFEVDRFVSVYIRVRLMGIEVIVDTHEGVKVKKGKKGLRLRLGVVSR